MADTEESVFTSWRNTIVETMIGLIGSEEQLEAYKRGRETFVEGQYIEGERVRDYHTQVPIIKGDDGGYFSDQSRVLVIEKSPPPKGAGRVTAEEVLMQKHRDKMEHASAIRQRLKQISGGMKVEKARVDESIYRIALLQKRAGRRLKILREEKRDIHQPGTRIPAKERERLCAEITATLTKTKKVLYDKLKKQKILIGRIRRYEEALRQVDSATDQIDEMLTQSVLVEALQGLSDLQKDVDVPSIQDVQELTQKQEVMMEKMREVNETLNDGYAEKDGVGEIGVEDLDDNFMEQIYKELGICDETESESCEPPRIPLRTQKKERGKEKRINDERLVDSKKDGSVKNVEKYYYSEMEGSGKSHYHRGTPGSVRKRNVCNEDGQYENLSELVI